MESLALNAKWARKYIELLGRQVHVDLYDPTKEEEILLGLFSRCTRLSLWPKMRIWLETRLELCCAVSPILPLPSAT